MDSTAVNTVETVSNGSAKRLRLLCRMLGLADAVPATDDVLLECQFSVLGMMESKVRELVQSSKHDASIDEVKRLHIQLAGEKLRANQGWSRYESANKMAMNLLNEKVVFTNSSVQPAEPRELTGDLIALGRSEAVAMILQLDPEVALDSCTRTGSADDTGDYTTTWDAGKLHILFQTDNRVSVMMEKAEGEYWHNRGLREEAERLAAQEHTGDVASPIGWKLVPIAPTHEIVCAMSESQARDAEGLFPTMRDLIDFSGENKTHAVLIAAYAAAISAAPSDATAIQKDAAAVKPEGAG